MDGRPVWLASVSFSVRGRIVGAGEWSNSRMKKARWVASRVLNGIGDPLQERHFRMNITFCIHRAVSLSECTRLPVGWECAVGGGAGPPVQLLGSFGIPHTLASGPCDNPGRVVVLEGRPDLWVPDPCLTCPSCIARSEALAKGSCIMKP